MTQLTWPLRQNQYLRDTALGYWLGSNGPALFTYTIISPSAYPYSHLWYGLSVVLSTISFFWRRNAIGMIKRGRLSPRSVDTIFLVVVSLQSLLWSYITVIVFPQATLQEQCFITMMVVGVAAGSFPINAGSKSLAQVTLAGIMLPLSLGAFLGGQHFTDVLAVAGLIYMAVLMKTARVLSDMIKSQFDLAARNRELRLELEARTTNLVTQAQQASLGEMAGSMAHEINNPMTTLTTSLDLLRLRLEKNPENSQPLHPILDKMTSNINRVTNIISALRHFSHNTANEPLKEQNLREILHNTISLCREQIEAQGIRLEIGLPPALPLECRSTEISRALLNLIHNACDAVHQVQEKWIQISTIHESNWVQIRVTDSGPGIEPLLREKIMQPFFTTKTVPTGHGLGLSVASAIIKAHGGSVILDASSKNTTFVVTLPLKIYSQPHPSTSLLA